MSIHPFRNLGLKALSVVIATLIWLSVSGEQTVERSLRVPLELQNTPDQLELVDVPPPTVDVRVRGSSGLLSHLAPGDIVAVLDLAGARPGRRFFPVTADRVHGPSGVDVAQVAPSTITLEFQRTGSRMVRVMPSVEGQPAAGFAVDRIVCEPESVEVVGPDTLLRQLNRVATEPVSVAGLSSQVREVVTLGVSMPGVRLRTPGKATVTVEIRPLPVERVIKGIAIRARNLPVQYAASVVPAELTVDVKGPKDIVEGLTSEAFAAWVDLAALRPGRYNLQVHLEPPQRVDVVRVDPATAAVRIK